MPEPDASTTPPSDLFAVSHAARLSSGTVSGARAVFIQASSSRVPLIVDSVSLLEFLAELPASFNAREARDVARRVGIADKDWSELWDLTVGESIIVPIASKRLSPMHMFSRDHTFLDMSLGRESLVEDNSVMQEYITDGLYPTPTSSYSRSDNARHSLFRAEDLQLPHLWTSERYHLDFMIEGTFGARRETPDYYDPLYNYQQVRLIGKSIPSGGSRHPVEAYIDMGTEFGYAAGIYHFEVKEVR